MALQPSEPSSFGSLPPSQSFVSFEHATTPGGAGGNGCLTAVVGLLLVSFVVCGGGVFYGFIYLPEFYRAKIHGMLDASPMPDGDKQTARQQVDRVLIEYKARRIGVSRTLVVLQGLRESPLFPLATIVHAEQRYVVPSLLTDDEKADAKLAFQRLAFGVFEQYIIDEELVPLLEHITTNPGSERHILKDLVTDEELRLFLTECKLTADDAQVPNEPFNVNFGAAFKRAVDEALAQGE